MYHHLVDRDAECGRITVKTEEARSAVLRAYVLLCNLVEATRGDPGGHPLGEFAKCAGHHEVGFTQKLNFFFSLKIDHS
jgi:hypothetical protein